MRLFEARALTFCVVAWGRQQKAASTSSHFTSSIFTSLGTSVAVTRWGNTSLKALPACFSPVMTVIWYPGWRARRRVTSAPV